MLKALKSLIENTLAGAAPAGDRRHSIELAAAALLVEVARADHERDAAEEDAVVAAIRRAYALTEPEIATLVGRAGTSVESAVSLQEFTRVLNEQLGPEDKTSLITDLWRVAYADGRLDKYEEYMIRKIADLLYVPHSQFIRAKVMASEAK